MRKKRVDTVWILLENYYICLVMQMKTNAVVLHELRYGDSQLVVDMFTETMGRMSFICRVPKGRRGGVQARLLQPMNIIAVDFDYRQKANLQHPRNVQIAVPYQSIPFEPYKIGICLFLSEFLYHATRGEQENRPLYRYVVESLQWLDLAADNYANFHLVFMMRLSRFLGFFPNLEDYEQGCVFDMRNGVFTKNPLTHPDYINPEEASRMMTLMRMNFETMRLFKMSRQDRNRCVELIINFYRLHIPNFPELKSIDVLKSLYV